MNNSKEIPTDSINNQDKKSPPQNKAKSLSSFTPMNDKGNPSIMSRQNSAFKNLKSEIKSENINNIFPNATPKKSLNAEYFNSIISPFRDCPYVDSTPFKHGNYNISSPENLRFNSPMNGIIISDSKNCMYKNNPDIPGKKIDFNAESIDMMKLNNKIPLSTQNTNGYNNRIYNNINNNLFNQNSINIINNNNIDYSNKKPNNQNQSAEAYIENNKLNNFNNNNLNTMNNMVQINNSNKCTCSKTGCKKKYCACFSRGKYCDGCECKNCENFPRPNPQSPIQNIKNSEDNEENMESPKTQRVICNCTKSNCMKKYCECFKRGFVCNSLCRCLDCKNKVYINDMNCNNINISNEKVNYNMNTANNENIGYNNYISNMNNTNNNDSINTNNFYNYALHNNINNNIINNNIINNSYLPPETFGKSLDYSNPINFQSEAFGICIKKDELKLKPRKLNLNDNVNMKEALINNCSEINETPKFSNKKRLRSKNDNSTGIKTCPTTNSNSGNKLKKGMPPVNKYIKKKRLQLN